MYISILIRSKNLNSLNNLLFFFTKVIFFHKKIRFLLIKQKTKKLFFKSFSVLQSPHVNKKSGEKFEFRVYCKKIIIYSLETKNLIFIIKQEIEKMYSDIWLTIY
ncbi:MAG: 30S ribosomal protein S10, partial [Gloeomargaritales cyanobacterium]